ncbi:putative methyltransferase-like protein 25 [Stigmatopora argus]
MIPPSIDLMELHQRINEVTRFLAATLSIANAHTVEFYTHDVWSRFVAVTPEEVLTAIGVDGHQREPGLQKQSGATEQSKSTFGFCPDTNRLVDVHELLREAKAHSLPALGVCLSRDELLEALGHKSSELGAETGSYEPDEFMNAKKSHEVQSMAKVVDCLAKHCRVKQVIDVGSGKGYLSSFLSLQHGLRVFGIDSSSTNTHGAQERNRKLKKFSKAYQKCRNASREKQEKPVVADIQVAKDKDASRELLTPDPNPIEDLFLNVMSLDATQSGRASPSSLTDEERQRRKRENLERKARGRNSVTDAVFSPLTSYVTAHTELRELIGELEHAVLVGLHTCGDLAPSTLRMFTAKAELLAVCSVGCCYNKLSEEFEPLTESACAEFSHGAFGFPLSQHLRRHSWFCGRNARMSACLALERVTVGHGIQMESLFYRAVLHVILRDRYRAHKSEKRVGNVYAKVRSFVDYVRRALRKLDLDDSQLSDDDIQRYHDAHLPRWPEIHAFNLLKVTLAPCIEGLILLDRLCYLKEEDERAFSALVQLFDPLLSPRCYALVALKA